MKTKKYILLFLFLAFCITDCKKYPEGPAISFRFKHSRITGVYTVESYKVNDVDSTSSLTCLGYYAFDQKGILGGTCGGGFWDLINKKKDIWIDAPCTAVHVAIKCELVWKILRLTKDEFWIAVDYSGNHYEVKLKKIEDYKP